MAITMIDGKEYKVLSLSYQEAEEKLKAQCDADNGAGSWDSLDEQQQKILLKVFTIGYKEGVKDVIEVGGGELRMDTFSTTLQ